ncbi:unnamed protein product [Owenia fusiformis]|uniref:dihydrofolate reductase n=1 Tax=Owenia fusiformis TaxID=6347 RepID=A0A8J1XRM2_OWEFU|nr:unnamed protein product [Owenia fusiformis]
MSSKRLNLVVASCKNRGIGKNNRLPWRLSGDMAFFKRITSDTKDKSKQNAVIMGRKTWQSIPEKFRPLPNRVNVVISREMKEAPEGAYIARGLDEAIDVVTSPALADKVEGIFVIGGSSIYSLALESPHCHRIYHTMILHDFECDTFLPEFDTEKFQQVTHPDVPENIQTDKNKDKDISYKFEVLEKI